jgi:hypothetical protein
MTLFFYKGRSTNHDDLKFWLFRGLEAIPSTASQDLALSGLDSARALLGSPRPAPSVHSAIHAMPLLALFRRLNTRHPPPTPPSIFSVRSLSTPHSVYNCGRPDGMDRGGCPQSAPCSMSCISVPCGAIRRISGGGASAAFNPTAREPATGTHRGRFATHVNRADLCRVGRHIYTQLPS